MAELPRVTIVGLGPAGADLLTPATLAAIEAAPICILRTAVHPAAAVVADAITCDDLYESADTFDEVYAAVAERVVAAALEHGHALYAVPGSPLVLERSVDHLRGDERVEVELLAALSFLDVAWARLAIDPVEAGVRLVDGHVFATAAAGERGPLLVAHCHNQRVLSDIKLAVDDPGGEPVVVLQGLGTPDERVFELAWADLDRDVDADHLTSIYIPRLASPVGAELLRFQELVATLRRECPWDREQTHLSLRRHLIEEAYETVEALERVEPDRSGGRCRVRTTGPTPRSRRSSVTCCFQVVFHAHGDGRRGGVPPLSVEPRLPRGLSTTSWSDRHPHVFGGESVSATEPSPS